MRWISMSHAERLLASQTTAFCLASGADGRIEVFGETLLVSLRGSIRLDVGEARRAAEQRGAGIARVMTRPLVPRPGGCDSPRLLEGATMDGARAEVLEYGWRLGVDFNSGYNPGVFPDQRDNRVRLRSLQPRRVLNTFAHTGAFSVAAALEGAETVSVDASKAFLQRTRGNFLRNSLALEGHRFVVEDVPTYLARLVKRHELFDAIILDPPTFGRGPGGCVFRFERDFPDLLRLTHFLLSPGGSVLLSTNCHGWTPLLLREAAMAHMPRRWTFEEVPTPEDYAQAGLSSTIWAFDRS